MSKSESLIFIGMDVHQDTVTLAVFEGASKEPAVVQKLPNNLRNCVPAVNEESALTWTATSSLAPFT